MFLEGEGKLVKVDGLNDEQVYYTLYYFVEEQRFVLNLKRFTGAVNSRHKKNVPDTVMKCDFFADRQSSR